MLTSMLMAAALVAGPDPDAPVATARATPLPDAAATAPVAPEVTGAAQAAAEPQTLTTDQQIANWVGARTPGETRFDEAAVAALDDRKPHMMVEAGIGTGGYRSFGVAGSFPIGQDGRLDLSYRQVENGPYAYPVYAIDDGVYAFPGYSSPERALEYESRVRRPGGPPLRFDAGRSASDR